MSCPESTAARARCRRCSWHSSECLQLEGFVPSSQFFCTGGGCSPSSTAGQSPLVFERLIRKLITCGGSVSDFSNRNEPSEALHALPGQQPIPENESLELREAIACRANTNRGSNQSKRSFTVRLPSTLVLCESSGREAKIETSSQSLLCCRRSPYHHEPRQMS